MRRALIPAALAAALMTLLTGVGTDYRFDAGPAISDLARGDIHGFVSTEIQMGPLSILLRAPLAALAGPDSVWAYRLGALACLFALVGLGALLAHRAGAAIGTLAAALLVANPISLEALHLGHPEELLGAALCVAAVLLARDRQVWAAVALGAALATKQWALIAIAPVLLAAPRETRLRLAAGAAGVAAAVIVPIALADPQAFIAAMHHPAFGVSAMRTGNVWGVTAITDHVSLGAGESAVTYVTPRWLQHAAHPLVAVLTLGLGAAAMRRRAIDPLALLALLMLLRCALDPWDHAYYHAPFLAALVAWEVLEARRMPLLSALSAGWLGIVFRVDLPLSDLLYAAWALPMAGWLIRRAMLLEPRPVVAAPLPVA
ncbi:MAG TPA: glycosyltransferase 87 family protein [Solirubrobacteraceae bacterium]|jgi:hypothetical protein|nr:glycosyltransferase 87 family protein [Solirubrobacteraceae bacterium]